MRAVDLFAGAGGWSLGWQQATGVSPVAAVNHCAHAVRLHALNHPDTRHFCESVQSVDPSAAAAGRRVDWLHLSPDCTHFSRAKGGKPRQQGIRGLAWCGVDWAEALRPRILSLENVAEFESWGPLDDLGQPIRERAGETFREFVAELAGIGYRAEWRVMCAADFGAPTIRRRLFLVARRDGQPIQWPTPTHGPGRAIPWRTAAECIDWSLPCPSIFDRRRPLKDATCRRIAAGVVRYVLQGKPFLVTCNHGKPGFRGQAVDEPMRTITASRDAHGLVAPMLIQTGYGERRGQAPRTLDVQQPLGTVVAGGAKHALVGAFLARHYTGMVGCEVDRPLPTVTARDHHSVVAATLQESSSACRVAAFLLQYYGTGTSRSVNEPMASVLAQATHDGLVTVTIDGVTHVVSDIGLRMLEPRELARAQGFPDSYVLEGTKAQQIARIGNSVVPQLAAAIVRANLGMEAA